MTGTPSPRAPDFQQDVERDAVLVHAAMRGLVVPAAIRLGLEPDDAFVRHPEWLRRQPVAYIKRVADRVTKMEARQ